MLFDDKKTVKPIVHFNTNTLFDLAVGKYVRSYDGKWILDGGLSTLMIAITGREQCYKSTLSQSLMTRLLLIYKQIEGMIYDSESSLLDPFSRFSGFYGEESANKLLKQIKIYDKTTHDMGKIFDLIINIAKQKRDNSKDFMVETPFYSEATGGRVKVLLPSVVLIDSLTYMQSIVELDKYDNKSIDDSSTNTINLADANTKTKFVRAASNFCPNSGITLMSTGHVGDKIHMDSYAPKNKQLQYQKANDKIKGVGSGYTFLNSILVQTTTPKVLNPSGKHDQCLYPKEGGYAKELTETQIIVQRCKNNSSGDSIPFVFSQHEGLLSEVTNYHLLRSKNYFGLTGSAQSHHLALLPSVKFGRTDVRDKIRDYKFSRALQLTAELCFIKNYWHTANIPFNTDITPTNLKIAIDKHPKLNMDDVLESRGYWSLDDKEETRKYMSIMDILELISKTKGTK